MILVLIGLACGAVGFTGVFWLAWQAIDQDAE